MGKYGYVVDTWTKFFYESINRYRRNKSEKHKAKLKRLAKRDKEIAEELKPIREQLKLLEEKAYKLVKESRNIEQVKEKILDKYKYSVRTRELNPDYAG